MKRHIRELTRTHSQWTAARARRKAYRGFTLVELLVSVGVISVLASLFLPAIQAARESARQTQCRNNLKQAALAFQLHHDQHGFFPSAGWDWWEPPTMTGGSPEIGHQQRAGWGYQILPFVEAETVWRGGNATNDLDRILTAVGTALPLFFCPTRRAPQTLLMSDPQYLGGIRIMHGLCDYAGSNIEGTGVVRRFKPANMADVADGTSQTLLLGEKRMNRLEIGLWQEDDNEGYTAGFDEDTMRRTELPPAPDHFDSGDGNEQFGSSHGGSFNAAFVDGSVHTIGFSIDGAIFKALGNMSDNQIVNIDF